MRPIECSKCGSKEMYEEIDYVICAYCRVKFIPSPGDLPRSSTVISVSDDIQQLLAKCRNDPDNRRRFANLILDLDPSNSEALRYLR